MFNSFAFINSFHISVSVQNVLYGMELVLYIRTMGILLGNKGTHKRSNLFYAFFSSMMMLLITAWVVAEAIFSEKMWLLKFSYPGGAAAYWQAHIGVWYMDFATIAVIVLQLMTDALMIYRCRMMWNNYRIVIVPVILWFATLILGILVAWITSLPGNDYYSGVAAHFTLAYWSVSVFLNTTLTCIICYRIVRHGRTVGECLGQEYASLYFAVAATVVESVLPYTLFGIAFLVALGLCSSVSVALIRIYFLMMCISPQMLILRVVAGKAWDNDTFSGQGSTLEFSPGCTLSQWSDSRGGGDDGTSESPPARRDLIEERA